jgi:hypothetical protein
MASVQELELVLKPHESVVSGGLILIPNILILLTHVVSTISDSVKVTFLEEINLKRKQILFGAFTPQVTEQCKEKAGQEIYSTSARLEVVAKKAGLTVL